ncbi:MAG: ferrous iron transport protein A [Candidatus Bipolaricaulota bacterium]|nr:ferrous iron transport protein A [Candidatus Bipolaricaulota bacterium]MCX7844735.1 ferrous iron transport protein A [Candidatus Bipolaricaulota bacterium]MDW8152068.1 FeoA family protein [Candidatus Bipolaricaulota bacterium]
MNLNSIPRPLVELHPGQTGRVVALAGPSREVRLRLRALGLRPGARVRLLGRGPGGPVRIEVEGCCLALGAGVARRILVAPETEDQG